MNKTTYTGRIYVHSWCISSRSETESQGSAGSRWQFTATIDASTSKRRESCLTAVAEVSCSRRACFCTKQHPTTHCQLALSHCTLQTPDTVYQYILLRRGVTLRYEKARSTNDVCLFTNNQPGQTLSTIRCDRTDMPPAGSIAASSTISSIVKPPKKGCACDDDGCCCAIIPCTVM